MNTEKMIPMDFSRNITPPIYGDHVWDELRKYDFHISKENLIKICSRESNDNLFIISFADRPNTTGKQPVADDVFVDDNHNRTAKAGALLWYVSCGIQIKTWKPNHAAMLAKFKEQGANKMYTGKKAEEATHIIGLYFKKIIPGNMPEYLDNDGVWQLSSFSVESALNHKSLTELSRPIGERKEDHTIDGILKKAQPQGAKAQAVALTIEALDDNPDEQVPVLSEDWVIDHLTDKPTLEQQEQAGVEIGCCTNPKDFGIKPQDFGAIPDKPVFTQEMADSGGKPKATMECLIFNTLLDNPKYEKVVIDFIGEWCCVYTSESCRERSASVDDLLFKPIDNRTDKEKTSCALWDCIEQNDGDLNESSIDAFRSDLLSKFTIALNKE